MQRIIFDVIDGVRQRTSSSARIDATNIFRTLALGSALLCGILSILLVTDGRILGTEPTWLKPLKFALSFTVLFATEAMVTARLSKLWRHNAMLFAAAVASGGSFIFEMGYMILQASRLEMSHFNESTPWHELMYSLMGVGATILMATIGLIALAVLIDRSARLSSALRLSIVLGFWISVVMTFWVAGELAANGGRFVGTPSTDTARIPFVGWSLEVGDLRPAHFLSLHAMQFIPLLGLLVEKMRSSLYTIWLGAALYCALTMIVFFQALAGIPILSL